jgi:hypothetical protein
VELSHNSLASLLACGHYQRPEDALAWFGTHSRIPREVPWPCSSGTLRELSRLSLLQSNNLGKIKLKMWWMNPLKYGAMQGTARARALGRLYGFEELNLVYLTNVIKEDGDLRLRGDPFRDLNQWV